MNYLCTGILRESVLEHQRLKILKVLAIKRLTNYLTVPTVLKSHRGTPVNVNKEKEESRVIEDKEQVSLIKDRDVKWQKI